MARVARGGDFVAMAGEFGLNLANHRWILATPTSALLKALEHKMTTSGGTDFSSNITEAFVQASKNPVFLRSCLVPLLDSAGAPRPESLVRVLLLCAPIQARIIELLLQKLPEFAHEDGVASDTDTLPRLILTQLRWLDFLHQPKALLQNILDVIEISGNMLRNEIITSLPDIVDDQTVPALIEGLQELLSTNTSLTVPILDALTNLHPSEAVLSEIRSQVIAVLDSYDPEALPVILRFILQYVTPANAAAVVSGVRSHLGFETLSTNTNGDSSMGENARSTTSKDVEVLALDAIRNALRFNKSVSDAWLKLIADGTNPSDVKPLDWFVLLMLHALPNNKKPIEALLLKKLKALQLGESTLVSTFEFHNRALFGYFPTMKTLADLAVRSKNPFCIKFGCCIYDQSFRRFDDKFVRHEIAAALVAHIGSGNTLEIAAALDVLTAFADDRLPSVKDVFVYLKGVLGFVDSLSVPHARKLFALLFTLSALANPDEQIDSEIPIFIRKLFANTSEHDKRMGVTAVAAAVRALSHLVQEEETCLVPVGSGLHPAVQTELIGLLDTALTEVTNVPLVRALFIDELACSISVKSPKIIQDWIANSFFQALQDLFIASKEEPPTLPSFPLAVTLQSGLDQSEDGEGDILINFMSFVISGSTEECAVLFPLLKLSQMYQKITNSDSLSEIDALLVCPILLPQLDESVPLRRLDRRVRDVVCHAQFCLVNWIRELLNAFAKQPSMEMKARLLDRIENLTTAQERLVLYAAENAGFVPLPASFEEPPVESTGKSVKRASDEPAAKKPKKKGRASKGRAKSKEDMDDEADADMEGDGAASDGEASRQPTQAAKSQAPASHTKPDAGASDAIQDLSFFVASLRELEIEVFELLKFKLLQTELDSEMHTKPGAERVLSLKVPQLGFLLRDLVSKLACIMGPEKTSPFGGQNKKKPGFACLSRRPEAEVIGYIVSLSNALCGHLELCLENCQSHAAESDGVMDAHGTLEKNEHIQCLDLILQAFLLLLRWPGFKRTENLPTLRRLLKCVASRMAATSLTQMNMETLVTESFEYVAKFALAIPLCNIFVVVLKILLRLGEFVDSHATTKRLRQSIAGLCLQALQRIWTGDERRPILPEHLTFILTTHFECSEERLVALDVMTGHVSTLQEALKADSDAPDVDVSVAKPGLIYASNTDMPTLCTNTLHIYYSVLLGTIAAGVQEARLHKDTGIDVCHPPRGTSGELLKQAMEEQMEQMVAYVKLFEALMRVLSVTSAQYMDSLLAVILRQARSVADAYIRCSVPILDGLMLRCSDVCVGLMRDMQKCTRLLQRLCCHSKVEKNVALTARVPALKKCLEKILLCTKEIMAKNGLTKAFWLGNLKNKTLDGAEVLSQEPQDDSGDDGQAAEEEGEEGGSENGEEDAEQEEADDGNEEPAEDMDDE